MEQHKVASSAWQQQHGHLHGHGCSICILQHGPAAAAAAAAPHLLHRLGLVLQVDDDLHNDEEQVDHGQNAANLRGGKGAQREQAV